MKAIIVLAVGFSLYLLLRGFSTSLRLLFKIKSKFIPWQRVIPVAHVVVLLLYIFWAMDFLLSEKSYYPYLLTAIVITICLLVGWFLLRDMVAGAVLKAQGVVAVGGHLRVNNYSGTINELGLLRVKMETDNGQHVSIPFSQLDTSLTSTVATDAEQPDSSFQYTIRFDNDAPLDDLADILRNELLSLPWVSPRKPPAVKWLRQLGDQPEFEITCYLLNQRHALLTEEALAKLPQVQVRLNA